MQPLKAVNGFGGFFKSSPTLFNALSSIWRFAPWTASQIGFSHQHRPNTSQEPASLKRFSRFKPSHTASVIKGNWNRPPGREADGLLACLWASRTLAGADMFNVGLHQQLHAKGELVLLSWLFRRANKALQPALVE